jgi:hypothetical protein
MTPAEAPRHNRLCLRTITDGVVRASTRYAYPKDYNPADYLLKCCSRGKDDTTEEEENEERRRIDRIVDAFDSEPAQVALKLVTDDRWVRAWARAGQGGAPGGRVWVWVGWPC